MPDRPLDAIRKLGALRDEARERVDRGQAGRGEEHPDRAPGELLVPRVMGGDGDEQEQESLENPGPTRAGVEREEGDERQGGDPGDRRKIDRGANPRRPVRKKPEKNRERDAEDERDGHRGHGPGERDGKEEKGEGGRFAQGVNHRSWPRHMPPS